MQASSADLTKLERSVLETLLYFHTEQRPLLLTEIDYFLLGRKGERSSLTAIKQAADRLLQKKMVSLEKGFYSLEEGADFSWLRQANRIKEAHRKIELTAKSLRWLSKIASIKEVCICGSVAARSCSSESDIDLLILTEKNRVWTARFRLTLLAWFTGKKKSDSHSRKNRFCLNHYRDQANLKLETVIQDRYSAKEYRQMIRIFGSGKNRCSLLEANQEWMGRKISNFTATKPAIFTNEEKKRKKITKWGDFFEKLFRSLQRKKIAQSTPKSQKQLDRSRIILENGVIMFHLNPKAPEIARKFSKLKNKFFSDNESAIN